MVAAGQIAVEWEYNRSRIVVVTTALRVASLNSEWHLYDGCRHHTLLYNLQSLLLVYCSVDGHRYSD